MRAITLVGLILVALVLQACGGETATPSQATTSEEAEPSEAVDPTAEASEGAGGEERVVHLFGIQPLTGTSANAGQRAQGGAEIAVAEINAAGGVTDAAGNVYTFEITPHDMANDRAEAIALLREAAGDDQYLAVVGPSSSVGFVPMAPVAGQLGMPVVATGSGAPITEWNEWVFRTNPAGAAPVRATMSAVVPAVGAEKVGILYELTQDAMVGDSNAVQALEEELGYEVVAVQSFRVGDQNFSAQITALNATEPDLIYIAGSAEVGAIVQQLREMGIETPVVGGYGTLADPQIWDLAGGATVGGYTWLVQDSSNPTPEVEAFFGAYLEEFGEEATVVSVYGYDAVYAIAEAVKESGSATDRGALAEALASLDFTTPIGTRISWENPPNGDLTQPTVGIYRVTGRGEYERIDQ